MKIITKIKQRLQFPLPGEEVQYQLAPKDRKEFTESVLEYKQAAVLSLIYPKKGEPHMVFIQRTSHKRDKHSAQIAFPGGRIEEADEDAIAGALREAKEEINVDPSSVKILGEMTPLKVPVSGFEVFPVLGYSEVEQEFIPQESEVQKIIEVPISQLVDRKYRDRRTIKLSTGLQLKEVPVFDFHGNVVWGATSMMLNEIIDILT